MIDALSLRAAVITSFEHVACLSVGTRHALSLQKDRLHRHIAVTPGSTDPLLLVFGIGFMQVLYGVEYRIVDRAYNAMAVVRVDGIRV